jgi:hypothetical protein
VRLGLRKQVPVIHIVRRPEQAELIRSDWWSGYFEFNGYGFYASFQTSDNELNAS